MNKTLRTAADLATFLLGARLIERYHGADTGEVIYVWEGGGKFALLTPDLSFGEPTGGMHCQRLATNSLRDRRAASRFFRDHHARAQRVEAAWAERYPAAAAMAPWTPSRAWPERER